MPRMRVWRPLAAYLAIAAIAAGCGPPAGPAAPAHAKPSVLSTVEPQERRTAPAPPERQVPAYAISPATQRILASMKGPVKFELYVSKGRHDLDAAISFVASVLNASSRSAPAGSAYAIIEPTTDE